MLSSNGFSSLFWLRLAFICSTIGAMLSGESGASRHSLQCRPSIRAKSTTISPLRSRRAVSMPALTRSIVAMVSVPEESVSAMSASVTRLKGLTPKRPMVTFAPSCRENSVCTTSRRLFCTESIDRSTYSNAGTPTATSSSSDTSTRRIFQIRYINTAPEVSAYGMAADVRPPVPYRGRTAIRV